MFRVEIIGNVGADAEIKNANGNQFVSFRVAHTVKFTNQKGDEVEETSWIDCTMNNTQAKVIPYIKQGVKVFVRGNASLRVYSSKKDRMMKAGLKISVGEIELLGGLTDEVPRQVVVPETGALLAVTKHYWADPKELKIKKGGSKELLDVRGHQYLMDFTGFIKPVKEPDEEQGDNPGES